MKTIKNFTILNWVAILLGVAILCVALPKGNFMAAIFFGAPLLVRGVKSPILPKEK